MEKVYNAGYYQRNRDKILTKAKERNQNKRGPASHDIYTAPLFLYEDSPEFFSYSDKVAKVMKNSMNKTVSVIKKIPSLLKRGVDFVSKIKDVMKTPMNAIKNLAIVQSVKSIFKKMKHYWNSATI